METSFFNQLSYFITHLLRNIIRVFQTVHPPHLLSPVLPTVTQFSESCRADWRTALAQIRPIIFSNAKGQQEGFFISGRSLLCAITPWVAGECQTSSSDRIDYVGRMQNPHIVIFRPCLLGEWHKLHSIYSVKLQHGIVAGKKLII